MSYQTWHEYGFGFIFSGFEAECEKIGDPITVEDVEHLLACNLPLHRDVHEWLDEIREDNPGYVITLDLQPLIVLRPARSKDEAAYPAAIQQRFIYTVTGHLQCGGPDPARACKCPAEHGNDQG